MPSGQPGFFRQAPDGTITNQFQGSILADGLQLNAFNTANPESEINYVQWVDPSNGQMVGHATTGIDASNELNLSVEASRMGGNSYAALSLDADLTVGAPGRVSVRVGDASNFDGARILTSRGESDFARLYVEQGPFTVPANTTVSRSIPDMPSGIYLATLRILGPNQSRFYHAHMVVFEPAINMDVIININSAYAGDVGSGLGFTTSGAARAFNGAGTGNDCTFDFHAAAAGACQGWYSVYRLGNGNWA